MSTKPGIPDHFSIHDVRDAAAGSPPAGGGTATRAQLQAMRNLSIPYDSDHPPTFDDAARLIREAEEAENPMRVVMGPPVRDIREAMHPAGEAPFTATVEDGCLRIATKPDPGARFTIAKPGPPTVYVNAPHVATLPDGSRVNLPAGTVLREGEVERGQLPPTNLNDALLRLAHGGPDADKEALMHFIRCWHQPSREIIARDLLQRARIRLVDEPDAKKLDAEIVAFLAGAAPPEHPVIALVRSFVGKPGDRGPVWTALMRLRERLDETGDLASVDLGDELVAALNERLGQMHDALGRDTAEGSR